MKRIVTSGKALTGFVLTLAATFAASSLLAQTAKEGQAVIRAIHGIARYSVGDQAWKPLKVGMTLPVGAVVQTATESLVDMSVNQRSAVMRVAESTTVKLDKMLYVNNNGDVDSETQVDLQSGTISGSVKKLSKSSHYDIKTPRGLAGIRGTDYRVKVVPLGDGLYKITFTSVTGEFVLAVLPYEDRKSTRLNSSH